MKKILLSISILLLFVLSSVAQEGMWLLTQIDQLDLNKKGLEIPTNEIYTPGKTSLYQAVVQLGGGTASFVSPDGLILTNHHVAYTALQRASSVEDDFLTNGFIAWKRSDEIQAPGYQALLLQDMKDVTDEVLKAGKGVSDVTERDHKINEKIAEMQEKGEKGKEDAVVRISEMYNGKQYIQFTYKQFKDIRIVYSPPKSIGKYGGDIDNWMWPRHTGDFSFMRIYVSPEGIGKEYSQDNVPYHPEVWLKASNGDLGKGDFTFIIGFPGFTTRYRTSNSAEWNLKYNYPFTINNFREIIDFMDRLTENDPEGKLKVAGLRAGLANTEKNYQGKVDGMTSTHFVDKKKAFEQEFTDWVNSSPETRAKYGHILDDIKAEYEIIRKTKDRDNVLGLMGGLAGTELAVAGTVYYSVKELEKPEKDRTPGFDEKSVQRITDNLKYNYANFYEPLDKELLLRALQMASDLPQDQRITALDYILDNKSISLEQFVDNAYAKSRLNDLEYATGLFGMSSKELEALDDPIMKMAIALYGVNDSNRETYNKFAANITELRKEYIDALYDWKGKSIYPDANGTMRLTYGPVKGYSPKDAVWYFPFTTLHGVVEKNTGIEPFNAPEKLIWLSENHDYGRWMKPELDDVPVAFTHMGDITGGNSGSPVMNAKGELIGVAFDGNYEAMISDWQYDAELQRVISVDIRYVLFVTEEFSQAGFILDEMGVKRSK